MIKDEQAYISLLYHYLDTVSTNIRAINNHIASLNQSMEDEKDLIKANKRYLRAQQKEQQRIKKLIDKVDKK